jgi:GT2 family glycosyltransferase
MSKVYPLVSIITVNYNQAKVTIEWLHSIQKISYPNYEIIIVDNASADNALEDLLIGQEKVVFIKSNVNKGFAGGNNLGIERAKGELLLLLNNDTEVESDFLQPLVDSIQSNQQIGMVSPKIKYFYHKHIIQYAGGSKINPLTGRGNFIGSGEADGSDYSTKATELIHGCAMLVPRRVINDIGTMEEAFFLYYEELDWCERAKRAGYLVYVVAESVIYHKESLSVGKNSPLRMFYITRNRLLFMQRNFSAFSFLIHLLYFLMISLPKNIISLLINGRLDLLQAYVKGIAAYILLQKSRFLHKGGNRRVGIQKKLMSKLN